MDSPRCPPSVFDDDSPALPDVDASAAAVFAGAETDASCVPPNSFGAPPIVPFGSVLTGNAELPVPVLPGAPAVVEVAAEAAAAVGVLLEDELCPLVEAPEPVVAPLLAVVGVNVLPVTVEAAVLAVVLVDDMTAVTTVCSACCSGVVAAFVATFSVTSVAGVMSAVRPVGCVSA